MHLRIRKGWRKATACPPNHLYLRTRFFKGLRCLQTSRNLEKIYTVRKSQAIICMRL
jgi:hypothetical protein